MKKNYFLLILFFTFSKVYAQESDGYTGGYIVTLTGDTSVVLIKTGGFLGGYNMNAKVKIRDSNDKKKVLTPNDIKGYGYTDDKSKEYVYRAKMIKDSSLYFLEPIVVGQKTSLYSYSVTSGGGYGFGGGASSTQEFYTFEKSDSTHLFMTNYAPLDKFKEKLKSFYKENIEVQRLIDTRFEARRHIQRDIKEIEEAFNK